MNSVCPEQCETQTGFMWGSKEHVTQTHANTRTMTVSIPFNVT